MNMNHDHNPAMVAITGIVVPALGIIASSLPAIESWLRIIALLVAIASGLATLWKIKHTLK